MNKRAVIVSAVRTAIAKEAGFLREIPPEYYAAEVIKEAVKRSGVDANEIDDVIFGNTQAPGGNIARLAVLMAGLPVSIPGVTIDRQCGAGLQCVNFAAHCVDAGDGDVYVAGGVESMTRAPYHLDRGSVPFQRVPPPLYFMGHLAPPEMGDPPMGITAENVAEKYGISRGDQDAYGLVSQERAARAQREGYFRDQILRLEIPQRKGPALVFDTDEHPRPGTTLEALSGLSPVFKKDGTVTAGSSSGINDGAAALVVMSKAKAADLGAEPLATVIASAVAGVHPTIMGIGPVPAVQKVLRKAGLTVDDMDVIELNEAFASQSLACMRELRLDPEKVNVNGGAIALGHPIAGSGAIIMTKLVYELKRRGARYGLATMCVGGGQGIATIVEREQ